VTSVGPVASATTSNVEAGETRPAPFVARTACPVPGAVGVPAKL
jgi:hypothetical protein